jgi:iron complex outermembrane receptor protein
MHAFRRHHGLACCAAPTLLLGTAALAQTPATQGPLEEIIVRATMIERRLEQVPAAVSVVDQDAIQLGRQQLALDEALSRVPGLFMQNRYNFAQDLRLSIRGFGARAQFGIRGIKVLVDGIPETLPDGQGSVDSIDLGATSQIEVIRGPSSSLYGNASGGVVSLTSEGGGADPYAQVRVASGGYGFEKTQFKTGGRTERLDYLVSLSDQELDGYRVQSAYKNKLLTGRFDLDLGNDRSLLTVLNLTDQPVSDDAGGLTPAVAPVNPRSAAPNNVLFDAGESLEQQRLGFVFTAPAGERGTITARNYYAWRDFGNLLPVQAAGIVDLDRKFVGGGFSYSYDGFWLDRPNRFVAGVDFDDQDDERRRYDNLTNTGGGRGALSFDQNEHVTSQGIFLQNELSVSERVQLSFGIRFDQVEFEIGDRYLADGRNDSGSKQFDDTSPMVGLVVELSDDLNFYTTYSSAFETPTTTEFNRADGLGGFNQALDPQVARNFEVGLRGALGDSQRYEVTLFTIDVEDELIGREIPASPGRNFFENAGETSRKGLEFAWIANPTDRIQTTISYTYSDFKFDRFVENVPTVVPNPTPPPANITVSVPTDRAGRLIPGTAENVIFGEFAYRAPRGWYAAADVLYVDEQFGDNANTVVIGDYTLTNLRFGHTFELGDGGLALSPFVGINNLTDEDYTSNVRLNAAFARYFEPGPGRNGYAGVTLDWNFR